MKRVAGRLLVDDMKSEASDTTVPVPTVTRCVLVEQREGQEKGRVDARDAWHDHGLVFPTTVATPVELRS